MVISHLLTAMHTEVQQNDVLFPDKSLGFWQGCLKPPRYSIPESPGLVPALFIMAAQPMGGIYNQARNVCINWLYITISSHLRMVYPASRVNKLNVFNFKQAIAHDAKYPSPFIHNFDGYSTVGGWMITEKHETPTYFSPASRGTGMALWTLAVQARDRCLVDPMFGMFVRKRCGFQQTCFHLYGDVVSKSFQKMTC